MRRFKRRKPLLAALVTMTVAAMIGSTVLVANAEEPPKSPVTQDLGKWLYDQAKPVVEDKAKSFAKEMLTTMGSSLLNAYLPGLGDIFFGGGGESESQKQFKALIERMDQLEETLSGEIGEVLDELQDQQEVDIRATLKTTDQSLITYGEQTTIDGKISQIDRVCKAEEDFNMIRNLIEGYVRSEATTSRSQIRRMDLIQLHITAAEMAVQSGAQCNGLRAIQTSYDANHNGDESLAAWADRQSRADIKAIQDGQPGMMGFATTIRQETLAFYDQVAQAPWVDNYLNDVVTPPVSHAAKLTKPGDFQKPDVIKNEGNWRIEGGAVGILDGQRWQYYVDIPRKECVDHEANQDLTDHDTVPWMEKAGEPTASDCNRFWVLSGGLEGTDLPGGYLGSFDGYSMHFKEPETLLAAHRQMLKSDIILKLYGPTSLILDRVFTELNPGQARPKNAWDNELNERDHLRGILAAAKKWDDKLQYEQVLEIDKQLDACKLNFAAYATWQQLLRSSALMHDTGEACSLMSNDTDGDGLTDAVETMQTNTLVDNADSDGDGAQDFLECLSGINPLEPDSDGDGLSDGDEVNNYKSWANKVDTDGDTVNDGDEVNAGIDPTKADTDSDNVDDDKEIQRGTDPKDPNSK